ncbi:hypothetical protein IW262DRAFT_1292685 [Armillaria fumosa]|nr:hypothetical protein IW262DRAFT_1292685 [Armillaria fumosa]
MAVQYGMPSKLEVLRGYIPLCRWQVRQARSPSIGVAPPSSTSSSREPMSIRYYYLHSGLQKTDSLFGDPQQTYTRSALKADLFPGNVLLEAERRYGAQLMQNGVDKLSIFCGWHRSRNNPRYHYTLRGYNAAGWMAFTVEIEAGTQGIDFAYGQLEWNIWLARAGGNLAMLRAKHFFDLADHVEAGISWEGMTAGVDTLWRPLPPSYPVLFPAPNHSADNPVTRGYTTIIQVMHEYSFFCSARFLDGDDVSLSEERGYLYYPETAKDHPARV